MESTILGFGFRVWSLHVFFGLRMEAGGRKTPSKNEALHGKETGQWTLYSRGLAMLWGSILQNTRHNNSEHGSLLWG